ncbi:hypothetical protein MTR67_052780 [Solanum verrucosum]|nr:hypothetical protein MTR67_052780 [Solanum verrucosum]
MVTIHGL